MAELLLYSRVIGLENVQALMRKVPSIFQRRVFEWLKYDSDRIMGTKGKPGLFKRKLLQRQKTGTSRTWSPKVAGLFRGVIYDPVTKKNVSSKSIKAGFSGAGLFGSGISQILKMGMFYNNRRSIHKAMEFLEEGGSVSSSKYMPIPAGQYQGMKDSYRRFKYYMSTGQLNVIYKNGLAYYFYTAGHRNAEGNLMFIGTKNINVRFRIGFKNDMSMQRANIEHHGKQAVEKAVAEAQRG